MTDYTGLTYWTYFTGLILLDWLLDWLTGLTYWTDLLDWLIGLTFMWLTYYTDLLYLTVGFALKNYPKITFRLCENLSTISEVIEMSFSMSADVYSDLTIRLALKNYPKMTLKLPKSIHWFKRYIEIIFYIIWYVQKDS